MNLNLTIKLGIIGLITALALLLIAFVLGLIDSDALTSTGAKTAAVIGIVVLSIAAISALTNTKK